MGGSWSTSLEVENTKVKITRKQVILEAHSEPVIFSLIKHTGTQGYDVQISKRKIAAGESHTGKPDYNIVDKQFIELNGGILEYLLQVESADGSHLCTYCIAKGNDTYWGYDVPSVTKIDEVRIDSQPTDRKEEEEEAAGRRAEEEEEAAEREKGAEDESGGKHMISSHLGLILPKAARDIPSYCECFTNNGYTSALAINLLTQVPPDIHLKPVHVRTWQQHAAERKTQATQKLQQTAQEVGKDGTVEQWLAAINTTAEGSISPHMSKVSDWLHEQGCEDLEDLDLLEEKDVQAALDSMQLQEGQMLVLITAFQHHNTDVGSTPSEQHIRGHRFSVGFMESSGATRVRVGEWTNEAGVKLPVAFKCLIEPSKLDRLQNEKEILNVLRDKELKGVTLFVKVHFFDHKLEMDDGTCVPALILERGDVNLKQYLEQNFTTLSEPKKEDILWRIGHIIQAVHEAQLVACDFKPTNIVLFEERHEKWFKGIDPDCFVKTGAPIPGHTVNYAAPETLNSTTRAKGIQDSWSFALIMFEVCTGHHLYQELDGYSDNSEEALLPLLTDPNLQQNIDKALAPFLNKAETRKMARALSFDGKGLLQVDAAQRTTVEDTLRKSDLFKLHSGTHTMIANQLNQGHKEIKQLMEDNQQDVQQIKDKLQSIGKQNKKAQELLIGLQKSTDQTTIKDALDFIATHMNSN